MKALQKLKKLRKLYSDEMYGDFQVLQRNVLAATVSAGRENTVRIRAVIKDLLYENDCRLGIKELTEGIKSACKSDGSSFRFNDSELYAVQNISALICLDMLYEAYNPKLLENIAYTLRSIEQGDTEEFIRELSETDAILRNKCGFYASSDPSTRSAYRRNAAELAKKYGITQPEAAEKYSDEITSGNLLSAKSYRTVFFCIYIFGTLLLGTLCFLLFRTFGAENAGAYTAGKISGIYASGHWVTILSVIAALISLIPLSEMIRQICDRIFSGISHPESIPSLELKSVPDEGKTVVVITTLLFGGQKDDSVFTNLEHFYLGNRDKNICFGILGDLPDSSDAFMPSDESSVKYAEERIAALNIKYGGGFCLFIRRRSRTKDGKFMGWERKRGAVIELSRLIAGRDTTFTTVICDKEFISDTKYIITLDADTRLPLGGAKKMIAAMLHPSNKPVIKDGRVVKGHAILQPRIATTADSAGCTPFSVLCTGAGGTDIYASAAYDTYQTLFDEGIFCGKGIIDIRVFFKLMDNRFPEETVLSHDLLEGSYLRSGIISSVTFSDSTPKNKVSYNKRLHRWIRGDVQSAAFARKPLNALSIFKIWDNIRRALVPVFSVALLLISFFLGEKSAWIATLAALSYILLPLLSSVIDFLIGLPKRILNESFTLRHFSRISVLPAAPFVSALYEISSLFDRAATSLDAVLRSIVRMTITHRRLLEWTTAAEGDMYRGYLSDYTVRMMPAIIAGAAFMLLPCVPLQLIGLAWFCQPFWSWRLGKEYGGRRRKISEKNRNILVGDMHAMWNFFKENVTAEDSMLPCDNIALSPEEKTAHRTSPTNIGLYMLSVLAARDFGFIDSEELYDRISKTLDSIESMSKWRGHLYNWYDTRTKAVLMPYVSTVDSGNFVASIITLRYGIEDYFDENPRLAGLIKSLDTLIRDADYSIFYNQSRGLLYTGVNTTTGMPDSGCYDLFMSECRTASYVAIAKGDVPPEHWEKLGRPLVSRGGRLGVLSWSGTAFEYFMPALFIEPKPDTLEWEALSFAIKMQKDTAVKNVWGRSEGCYFAFDADMNYCYRAFGSKPLAISGEERDHVITPYSSYLMLPFAPSDACSNLDRLRQFGMYGKFGFYESIDMTPSRVGKGYAAVKCFMSHHLGMSMIAVANACMDGIFCKRFMRSPDMASARSLSDERIPIGAIVTKKHDPVELKNTAVKGRSIQTESINTEKEIPSAAAINGGSLHLVALSDGAAILSFGRTAMTAPVGDRFSVCSGHVDSDKDDIKNDIGEQPASVSVKGIRLLAMTDGTKLSTSDAGMSFTKDSITYRAEKNGIRLTATWQMDRYENAVHLRINARGHFCEIVPMLYLEPVMSELIDYTSHPAYSTLAIESEYIPEEGILLFDRRIQKKESGMCMAISFRSSGNVEYASRRREIMPPLYSEADIAALYEKNLPCNDGVCIDPVAVIRKSSHSKKGIYSDEILISCGHSKDEAIGIIRRLREKKHRGSSIFPGIRSYEPYGQSPEQYMEPQDMKLLELILTHLFFRADSGYTMNKDMKPDDLWKYGISSDNPIITVEINKDDNIDINEISKPEYGSALISFMRCARFLFLSGIKTDIVFFYCPTGGYREPVRDTIKKAASEGCADFLLGRRGGVHVVGASNDKETEMLLKSVSRMYINITVKSTVAEAVELGFRTLCKYSRKGAQKNKIIRRPEIADEVNNKRSHSELSENISAMSSYLPDGGYRIVKKAGYKIPWSYICTGKSFGTLVTQNTLGFTWFTNSRERRITPWSGDAMCDCFGEALIAEAGEKRYDLCAYASEVIYRGNCAEYIGEIDGAKYSLKVSVDQKLPVKLIHFESEYQIPLRYNINISAEAGSVQTVKADNTKFFICRFGSLAGMTVFLSEVEKNNFLFGIIKTPKTVSYGISDDGDTVLQLIGSPTYKAIKKKYLSGREISSGMSENGINTGLYLKTGTTSIDELFNSFLPRQIYASRMRGRTGFYQPGGAYGFRDQLQDSLALIYCDPSLVRTHIIRCAARQYTDGSVMHWWHDIPGYDGKNIPKGIRTRCSDDYLWLPFTVCEYINRTGDQSVLDVEIPYLDSSLLEPHESDRYETPPFTSGKEALYFHCIRAISFLRIGPRGLPFIGSCDWNDGLSAVGSDGGTPGTGSGESVWLAIFACIIIKEFIPICKSRGDIESASLLEKKYSLLREATEKYGWYENGDEGFYIRAFYGDGTPIGAGDDKNCFIDLIPQAFAAMLNDPETKDRTELAMDAVQKYLEDRNSGIVRLLTPPFGKRERDTALNDPGYIKGYPDGMRENGGQYTHAAVWAAWALYETERYEQAYRIMMNIDPSSHDPEKYLGEPYALAGDVSANPDHPGKAGWTLYTGAAAWYYRLILEKFAGYEEHRDEFSVCPHICKSSGGFELTVNRKNTFYKINVIPSDKTEYRLDGHLSENRFEFDGKDHIIEIYVKT